MEIGYFPFREMGEREGAIIPLNSGDTRTPSHKNISKIIESYLK
jgi:hypothetical protein